MANPNFRSSIMSGATRADFTRIRVAAKQWLSMARNDGEAWLAQEILAKADRLEAKLGDIGDAIDWKLPCAAYDACDAAIDPRDADYVRSNGDYHPRVQEARP